jgi:hypothetical protein
MPTSVASTTTIIPEGLSYGFALHNTIGYLPRVSTALTIPVIRPVQKQIERTKNNAGEIRETLLLRLNAKETKGIVVRRNTASIDNGTMHNGFANKTPAKLRMSVYVRSIWNLSACGVCVSLINFSGWCFSTNIFQYAIQYLRLM